MDRVLPGLVPHPHVTLPGPYQPPSRLVTSSSVGGTLTFESLPTCVKGMGPAAKAWGTPAPPHRKERASPHPLGVGRRTLTRVLGKQVQITSRAVLEMLHESPRSHAARSPSRRLAHLGGRGPGLHAAAWWMWPLPLKAPQILPLSLLLAGLTWFRGCAERAARWLMSELPTLFSAAEKQTCLRSRGPHPGLVQALPLSQEAWSPFPGHLHHREWARTFS